MHGRSTQQSTFLGLRAGYELLAALAVLAGLVAYGAVRGDGVGFDAAAFSLLAAVCAVRYTAWRERQDAA